MKIQVIQSNLTNVPVFEAGMSLVAQALPTSLDVSIEYADSKYVFTPIAFSMPNLNGYEVDTSEILSQSDASADTAFLIFDASKMNPQPLNPTCTVERGNPTGVAQMCEHWYQTDANTFSSFFLHEICHRMFFALGETDITHLLTDGNLQASYPALYSQFNTKQPIEYYQYIITSLVPAWNQYKAGQIHMETLKIGATGASVVALQQLLIKIGYQIAPDGSFGPKTQSAVEDFQKKNGLNVDGIVGQFTQEKLQSAIPGESITDIITRVCNANGVEPELGIAVATCEGGVTNANITRQNTDTHKSTDRGIFQFNSYWQSNITDAQAFDPAQATQAFCDAVKDGKLVQLWHLSEPCWSTKLSVEIKQKYGIV